MKGYGGICLALILMVVMLANTGCDFFAPSKDNVNAEKLHDAAKYIVQFGLKNDAKARKDIGIAAGYALELLQAPDQTLQIKHWNGLLLKVANTEFKAIATVLLDQLAKYVQRPVGDAIKRLDKRTIQYLIAFFKGIKKGAEL